MASELAVAFAAIAAKAIVAQLIQGAPMTRADYGAVAGQVIDALVTTSSRQQSQMEVLSRRIDGLGQKIDDAPVREFDQYMAAGRRYLRDLPASWRTDQDRKDLIRGARDKFMHAAGIAEVSKDVRRQALAEIAIAGCWLWVPSINDVRAAAGNARRLLELEVLFGVGAVTADAPLASDYADVLKLCKAYGERPAQTALPTAGSRLARLTVRAVPDNWVECADVWVHVARSKQAAQGAPGSGFIVTVDNHRFTPVYIEFPPKGLVDVDLKSAAFTSAQPGSVMGLRAAIAAARPSLAPGAKSAWRVGQPSAQGALVTQLPVPLQTSQGRIAFVL